MGEVFFTQDDVKLTTLQALYCQNSKSGTKAISCVCKYYSPNYIEFTNNHTNLLHVPGVFFHLFLKLAKVTVSFIP